MGRVKYLPNYIFFLKGLMGMVWELPQREPAEPTGLTQVALPINDTPYGDDELADFRRYLEDEICEPDVRQEMMDMVMTGVWTLTEAFERATMHVYHTLLRDDDIPTRSKFDVQAKVQAGSLGHHEAIRVLRQAKSQAILEQAEQTEQAEQPEEERDYDSLKLRYDSLKSRYDNLLAQRDSLASRYEYLHRLYQSQQEQAEEYHSKALRYDNMMELMKKYTGEVGKPPYPVMWNDGLYFAVPTKFTVDRAVDDERVYLAPRHHRRRVNGYFLFQNGTRGRIFLVNKKLELVPHPHASMSGICTGTILDDYDGDDIVEMAKLLEAGMTIVNLNSLLEPNAKGYEPYIGITRGDIPFGWEVSQAWQGAGHHDIACCWCGHVIDPEVEGYHICDYCDGYLCVHGCDYTSEDGGTYCESCYYENYQSCESCSAELHVNDACYAEVDGYAYCERCYHEKFTRCYVCDTELYSYWAESCDECGQDVCEYCSTSETDSETGVLIITCKECR